MIELFFLFVFTLVFIFLTLLVELVGLILQLNGKKLSRWLGKSAFPVYGFIISVLWAVSFFLIFTLQFYVHPFFHQSSVLKYFGLLFLLLGLVLCVWALFILGIKRALFVNFFKKNTGVVRSSLYRYTENPINYGFWIALIGFSLFTKSLYNLIIAIEFIILMRIVLGIENKPVQSVKGK